MPSFVQDRPLDCSVMSLETLSSDSPLDNAIISTIEPYVLSIKGIKYNGF